jgi:Fe-S-cluster containining protein
MAEVTCETCVAACCRAGSTIMLTTIELQRHRRAMTIKPLIKPQAYRQEVSVTADEIRENGEHAPVDTTLSVPPHHGMYVFLLDCKHLEESRADSGENKHCTVYEERPAACRNFEPGSSACLSARAKFGVDGHEPGAILNREQPLRFQGWKQID